MGGFEGGDHALAGGVGDPGVVFYHGSGGGVEFSGHFRGKVGENHIGAGAADAEKTFLHGGIEIEPSFFGGGVHHGELAGDLIGGDGEVHVFFKGHDHVQVVAGGFDHEGVGTLGDIESGFAQGFAAVGGIHLIGFFVGQTAPERGGFEGAAEGSIEAGGVFGGVGEDVDVDVVVHIQKMANGADASVHHIGGGDPVDSGGGVDEGHFLEHVDGSVVIHPAIDNDAIVAVGGIGVEGDVALKVEFGEVVFQGADGGGHHAIGIQSGLTPGRFFSGGSKKVDGVDSDFPIFRAAFDQKIGGPSELAGQAGDGLLLSVTGTQKHGINQLIRVQKGLALESAVWSG